MADPDFIFTDGFDHYWPAIDAATLAAASFTGTVDLDNSGIFGSQWSFPTGNNMLASIGPPLNGPLGGSLYLISLTTNSDVQMVTPLPANFARIVGGVHIQPNLSGSANSRIGVTFKDGASTQLSIVFNVAGQIEVRRGGAFSGTLLATSVEAIVQGTTHYLAWDITFHASTGIIKIWLDNVLTTISLTGQNTSSSGVAQANSWGFIGSSGSNPSAYYDHNYLHCYTAAGGSELPILTSPIIESQQGTADNTRTFSVGASTVGNSAFVTTTTSAPGANQLTLIKITPGASCTLSSVGILPRATSGAAKMKAVLYADSAGSPGSLLATGTEVVGTVNGSRLALPFAAGQALTGATSYWIGYITDTSVVIHQYDNTTTVGQTKANTYTSGAPNPAGTMTTGKPNYLIWGNLTAVTTANYQQVGAKWASSFSWNFSSVVGDTDRVTFPALISVVATVHCVSLVAGISKSDGGARTIDLLTKSGATETNGSAGHISPALSIAYSRSNWLKDPATGLAWANAAAVNAAIGGYKIAA